jgi:hypothetical protein
VRASQPATFFLWFPFPLIRCESNEGVGLRPSFDLHRAAFPLHPKAAEWSNPCEMRLRLNELQELEAGSYERFVRHMKARDSTAPRIAVTWVLLLILQPSVVRMARAGEPALPEMKAGTLQAFERYVKLTEARNEAELKRGTDLLWVDTLPADQRAEAYAALKRGEVKMQKLETRDSGKSIPCPGGMIHHWTGIVFISGAKLEDVLGVLEDYDKHAVYYAPDVQRSKLVSRNGDHFHVYLRFRRHKLITVVMNTEHEVDYVHDAPGKAHSRSSAVRIAEVENAGSPDEREKTPGDDDGFLWRMETWWRMEERDGGVYVQSEVASLTRDIPTGLRWMIGPFVTEIPKETLTSTLVATRKAVQEQGTKH